MLKEVQNNIKSLISCKDNYSFQTIDGRVNFRVNDKLFDAIKILAFMKAEYLNTSSSIDNQIQNIEIKKYNSLRGVLTEVSTGIMMSIAGFEDIKIYDLERTSLKYSTDQYDVRIGNLNIEVRSTTLLPDSNKWYWFSYTTDSKKNPDKEDIFFQIYFEVNSKPSNAEEFEKLYKDKVFDIVFDGGVISSKLSETDFEYFNNLISIKKESRLSMRKMYHGIKSIC